MANILFLVDGRIICCLAEHITPSRDAIHLCSQGFVTISQVASGLRRSSLTQPILALYSNTTVRLNAALV